jgi:hypothetical protein
MESVSVTLLPVNFGAHCSVAVAAQIMWEKRSRKDLAICLRLPASRRTLYGSLQGCELGIVECCAMCRPFVAAANGKSEIVL